MKKTEYISFRTTAEVKACLKQEAESKKWSISQLVEEIVHQWVESQDTGNSQNDESL